MDIKKLRDRADRAERALETALIRLAARDMLSAAGLARKAAQVLEPHVVRQLRVRDLDSKPVVVALDDAGGEHDAAHALEVLKADREFESLFPYVPAKTGAAKPGQVKRTGEPNPFVKGPGFSATRQALLFKKSPDEARRLQAEAERADAARR